MEGNGQTKRCGSYGYPFRVSLCGLPASSAAGCYISLKCAEALEKLKKTERNKKNMEDLLQVGVIANTHGLQGEVKVFPTTDDVKRFKKLREAWLDTGAGMTALEVSQVKFFKNLVILKFKGYDNINDIEKYKGKGLFVTREQAVKCGKDEYFIADLIGLEVQTEEGELLGTVTDVIQTGANDVYTVRAGEGSPYASKLGGKEKELLLPAIKECILSIDLEERQIKVHLMPGLVEEG